MDKAISRPIEVLTGTREISAFLRVGKEAVLDMESEGAPIFRDNANRIRTDKAELWEWYKKNYFQ